MPSFTAADVSREVTLSNLARMRLEVISFFLLCLLLWTALIQRVWNGLRTEFAILPRLSYAKAFGLVLLWGLLFLLVLTMISGARELMTPGAWEKKGVTYQLASEESRRAEEAIARRYEAMEQVRNALRDYANWHDGAFPPVDTSNGIPTTIWPATDSVPPFIYRGGVNWDDEHEIHRTIVAYEPDAVGADRLVLLNDGHILWMSEQRVAEVLANREGL
jgi:hypothetical protein